MSYPTISLRDIIGDILNDYAPFHDIYVLDSDLAKSTSTIKFKKAYPERFIELGIAEQSAMSVAMGLSLEKKIPFYINFSMFVTGTAWTQLRQICYSNANVKIIGTHPGIDNGPDGATHHANEDLALARCLPNLTVIIPSNENELRAAIKYAIEKVGPVYIRVARDNVYNVDRIIDGFDLGYPELIAENGEEIALVFEGTSSILAYDSYEELINLGYKCKLINLRYVKPINEEKLLSMIGNPKGLITIENHSIIGGVASIIADLATKNQKSFIFKNIGIQDTFTESGKSSDLKEKYGLSVSKVVEFALDIMK